ncbi:uncharacterized protein GGS22DRAFT_138521 [Annulohypoxylon maeteangense]|uniref:uncharacterized protein n=1 Tax=Annulohypoxylon maeteangense TaxID=1927788 RepID=UPI0020087D30|nr:uncharacterized protein GGS22DRAFT_138521 [Annulohypoxylon maeteangense]KAI0885081.1 hypothetical protein GGS22DRAFT_138521 [Annulohypoxylon maeteangense]
MEILPSYEDAISNPDWLDLVAEYVPVIYWSRCCLVDHRFYYRFAPRLWQDPLVTIRRLGMHPNDDLAWYRRFINKHIKSARLKTRSYVRSLDFRSFASRASGLYSSEASERAISESFKQLPQIFPGLICLLVDGHPELNPEALATSTSTSESLQLLDLARCRHELTPKLFHSDLFRGLVYLDISYVPGSVKTALQSSLNPRSLPELRVLRVAGREIDNPTASLLFQTFRRQLWSLDLSYNKLGDDILDEVVERCVSLFDFHTDAHFEKEGKLIQPKDIGSRKYGPFQFVVESEYSSRHHNLERYLADSPFYTQRADEIELQEWQAFRPNGLSTIRRDDANTAKESLLDEAMSTVVKRISFRGQPGLREGGLTHLYLSGNKFTVPGIERLLRTSRGRLEHFECDSCLCTPANSKGVKILGFPSSAPLFRPLISSAIRSLRIHHSVVTQVPSVSIEGYSSASTARLAEDHLFRNIQRSYPLAFTPDTNTRITSLTLTKIPARSTGPVIDQLIQFLQSASAQQKAIRDAEALFRGRGSSALRGLRHIRLELESEFSERVDVISTSGDVDFDKLLDPADDDFSRDTTSFFDDEDVSFGITSRRNKAQVKPNNATVDTKGYAQWTSGRLKSYPYSDIDTEYMTQHVDASHSWSGNVYSAPVWIGPGVITPHAAVNEYMWNLQDPNLRTNIGPATPNHVAAGVPPLTYIFHTAWEAMIMPKNNAIQAAVKSSTRFKDVATAIKEYRLRTRGTADHWDGKLELVRTG